MPTYVLDFVQIDVATREACGSQMSACEAPDELSARKIADEIRIVFQEQADTQAEAEWVEDRSGAEYPRSYEIVVWVHDIAFLLKELPELQRKAARLREEQRRLREG